MSALVIVDARANARTSFGMQSDPARNKETELPAGLAEKNRSSAV
jgi:hypothetical protein